MTFPTNLSVLYVTREGVDGYEDWLIGEAKLDFLSGRYTHIYTDWDGESCVNECEIYPDGLVGIGVQVS